MTFLQRFLAPLGVKRRKVQRDHDRRYLFPTIRAQQETEQHGDEAILVHISIDAAWQHKEEWRAEEIEDGLR